MKMLNDRDCIVSITYFILFYILKADIKYFLLCFSLVPVFVDKCISYMEANGIYQEGIYRRSAAATQVKLLAEALDKDIECQKVSLLSCLQCCLVSSSLVWFSKQN